MIQTIIMVQTKKNNTEKTQHRLLQYLRRECLSFLGIPNTVPPKELQGFIIYALEEIGIKLNKSQIIAFHRPGKSDRTIVKFLIRIDTDNALANKEKFRYIDISKIVTEVSRDHSPEVQNAWRNIVSNQTKRKKLFISQNLCLYYRCLYELLKENRRTYLWLLGFQWHYPYEGASWFTCYWHNP